MLLQPNIDAIFLNYFLKIIWVFLDFAHDLFVAYLITMKKILLKSRRVVPTRLLESGFELSFPDWRDAAIDLCRERRYAQQAPSQPVSSAPAPARRASAYRSA